MLPIVTGMSIQPAVIPTAKGNVARRKMPRFLETMEPAKVVTRTYMAPGSSCSPVSGEGARAAIVLVNEVSCLNAHDIRELTPFSAVRDWSYKNNLAFFTCFVKRSVGVGLVGLG